MGGNFKGIELRGETEKIKTCNIGGKKEMGILIMPYNYVSRAMELDKEKHVIFNERRTKSK